MARVVEASGTRSPSSNRPTVPCRARLADRGPPGRVHHEPSQPDHRHRPRAARRPVVLERWRGDARCGFRRSRPLLNRLDARRPRPPWRNQRRRPPAMCQATCDRCGEEFTPDPGPELEARYALCAVLSGRGCRAASAHASLWTARRRGPRRVERTRRNGPPRCPQSQ